ncbi:MAG: hypothetical protein AB3X44_08195 [Leptothrix sp. (in: b-proteobacteria)]
MNVLGRSVDAERRIDTCRVFHDVAWCQSTNSGAKPVLFVSLGALAQGSDGCWFIGQERANLSLNKPVPGPLIPQ